MNSKIDWFFGMSARQREIVMLLAAGRSNKGIAKALRISEHSVEKHITFIFEKMFNSRDPRVHRRVKVALRVREMQAEMARIERRKHADELGLMIKSRTLRRNSS